MNRERGKTNQTVTRDPFKIVKINGYMESRTASLSDDSRKANVPTVELSHTLDDGCSGAWKRTMRQK